MAEWIEMSFGFWASVAAQSPLAMAEWIEICCLFAVVKSFCVSASDGGVD